MRCVLALASSELVRRLQLQVGGWRRAVRVIVRGHAHAAGGEPEALRAPSLDCGSVKVGLSRFADLWQSMAFTRENGAALHPEYLTRHFERLARDAGLPPIRLHDLRHGAATLALARWRGPQDGLGNARSLDHHDHGRHLRDRPVRGCPPCRRVRGASCPARAIDRWSTARPHLGLRRLRPVAHADERPGQVGCAARDLNPQPAD
jgi:hypothetical protein